MFPTEKWSKGFDVQMPFYLRELFWEKAYEVPE